MKDVRKRKTTGYASLKLHHGQLTALRVAVTLRIDALVDSGEKEMTYGWRILLNKINSALKEVEGKP